MSKIVSWEYYSTLYAGVSESEFDAAEKKAEMEVRSVIGPIRWAEIDEHTFGYDALQDCICKLIDQMATDERTGLGRGLASVSNDGYTEAFAVTGAGDLLNSRKALIRQWLSGTGLVGAY